MIKRIKSDDLKYVRNGLVPSMTFVVEDGDGGKITFYRKFARKPPCFSGWMNGWLMQKELKFSAVPNVLVERQERIRLGRVGLPARRTRKPSALAGGSSLDLQIGMKH